MRGVLAGCASRGARGAAGPAFPRRASVREPGPDHARGARAQLAQKKLEQEFSQRGQELQKLGEQIKKIQEGIRENAMTMLDSERQKREREFADANREFQRKQRSSTRTWPSGAGGVRAGHRARQPRGAADRRG